MSKLVYKTKKPREGCVRHESNMTHVTNKEWKDNFPSEEVQKKAHDLVGKTMYDLLTQLNELGYDETKCGFYIHFKE